MPNQVLHVVTDTDRRGAQVFAAELTERLRQRGRGATTVALTAGARGGIDADVLGPTRRGPSTLATLRRRIAASEIAVGFGSTTLPACALAGLGTGTPFVYRSIGEIGYWANGPARRARTRLSLRRADAVVVLWQDAVESLARFGVPASRIHVIPRGVPADRFPLVDRDRREAARTRFGLAPDRPTVVYLGSLSAEKRVDALVDALARLPDHQLLVAGDGPQRSELIRKAAAVAPGRAMFAGVVDLPAEALAAGDVLVLCSSSEGMPGVVIEAALSGLPVVASRVGAVPELVVDGATGRIVDRDVEPEALAGAIADALANASAWGPAGRAHALERYELGVVADRWEAMLDAVIGGRRRAR